MLKNYETQLLKGKPVSENLEIFENLEKYSCSKM